ncbi:hypothetical protein V8B55DRAFT_1410392 [Mucor lusitanicus]
MQVSPLLTPTNFMSNSKKRSRAYIDDDFESHYLKKRLISTIPNLKPPSPTSNTDKQGGNVTLSPTLEEEENTTSNRLVPIEDGPPYPNHIHLMDINGTLLPMEQKPGETKYSIPGFVLSDSMNKPLQPSSGNQLILYEKNPILASIEKEQQQHQPIDDNDSLTSEENDDDYDPMDLD